MKVKEIILIFTEISLIGVAFTTPWTFPLIGLDPRYEAFGVTGIHPIVVYTIFIIFLFAYGCGLPALLWYIFGVKE